MTPVHLRLLAWRRFESPHRHHARRFALRPQPVRQNRVSAAVVPFPQFPQQHLRVPHAGLQPLLQIWLEWFQFAHRRRPRSVDRPAVRLQQILPDRFAVVAGQPADRPNAQPFPFELVDLFHVFPPEQCRPSSVSRVGVTPLAEGVGIFQPALWGFLHRR